MTATAPPDVPVRSLRDILTALERHPEWRRALRQQLLGEELVQLPAMFAKFASETTRRLDLLTEELAAFKASTTRRLDGLAADVGTLKSDVGTLKSDVGTLKSDVGTLKSDMGDVKTAITKLTNDVGTLKGAHAEANARARIALIADDLDLEHRRIVPTLELKHMARDGGADLQDDAIKSFLNSDIIAETTDDEGETSYLAVETSFTGDLHDADRARNHAALVQRLTGRPCRAVIASSQKNAGLTKLIERGEIAWHELRIRIQPAG